MASHDHHLKGEHNWNARWTNEQVVQMRADHQAGADLDELFKTYGGSTQSIRKILQGISWRSVTGGEDIYRRLHNATDSTYPNRRRLTMDQANMLRKLSAEFRIAEKEWGALLGISQNSVNDVLHHRSYRS